MPRFLERTRARYRSLKHAVREAAIDGRSWARHVSRRLRGPKPRSTDSRHLLILDEWLPDPRFGAGYPRAAELLQVIVDDSWTVTVYPMNAGPADYVDVRRRFPTVTFLRSLGDRGLRRVLRESVGAYDVVLVSRPTVMERVADIVSRSSGWFDRQPVLYDAEAIFTEREALRMALFASPMSRTAYEHALAAETVLTRGARAILSVTEAEARLFRARVPVPVYVVSHTTPVRPNAPGHAARADLLFVGRSVGAREDIPNVDSLIWFVEEVMPYLDDLIGTGYRLAITGRADAELVTRLSSSRVVFAGIVDDLAPWYDRSRVFVAPTRYAAGLPLKVVEAAAAGIPCVVTDLLAGQLQFADGVECMMARDARAFAEGCAALYTDDDRWTRVRDAASARVARDYSRETFGAAIRGALDAALAAAGTSDLGATSPSSRIRSTHS